MPSLAPAPATLPPPVYDWSGGTASGLWGQAAGEPGSVRQAYDALTGRSGGLAARAAQDGPCGPGTPPPTHGHMGVGSGSQGPSWCVRVVDRRGRE